MENSLDHSTGISEMAWMSRLVTPAALALVDIVGAFGSTLVAIVVREHILPGLVGIAAFMPVKTYLTLWPAVALLLLLRALFGLYPGYGLNPAEELRRQTLATGLLAFFLLGGSALFQFSEVYSRLVIVETFLLLTFALPMLRFVSKTALGRTRLYGECIWLVGASSRAADLERLLRDTPALGLRVVGRSAAEPPGGAQCQQCLIVPEGVEELGAVLDRLNRRFRRVWLVPDLLDVSSVWVTPRDLQGHLALELRNNLLEPGNRFLKRASDTLLAILLAPLGGVMLVLAAVLIKLDSRGPVFFVQTRIGKDGKPFKIVKFRTMYQDAPARLGRYLAVNAAAQDEWKELQKLRHDPRVTRVGKTLRRFSLDELPQLWNVLRGEMSLVGPRAVHREELQRYGRQRGLYTAVQPGLTGLWQVSGRNRLSYEARVRLDTYYVRNWSLWLDLVILAKTAGVVLSGDGAY